MKNKDLNKYPAPKLGALTEVSANGCEGGPPSLRGMQAGVCLSLPRGARSPAGGKGNEHLWGVHCGLDTLHTGSFFLLPPHPGW